MIVGEAGGSATGERTSHEREVDGVEDVTAGRGDGTLATFDYRYVPRGGPIGRFTGPLIDKMLTANFTDMLAPPRKPPSRTGS